MTKVPCCCDPFNFQVYPEFRILRLTFQRSQPQNAEFGRLISSAANLCKQLDTDQAWQNVGAYLGKKKSADDKKKTVGKVLKEAFTHQQ